MRKPSVQLSATLDMPVVHLHWLSQSHNLWMMCKALHSTRDSSRMRPVTSPNLTTAASAVTQVSPALLACSTAHNEQQCTSNVFLDSCNIPIAVLDCSCRLSTTPNDASANNKDQLTTKRDVRKIDVSSAHEPFP